MKAFKVVRQSLRSARCGDVKYGIGKVAVAPENTRLFVFRDLEKAKSFAERGEDIYECEVTGLSKARFMCYEVASIPSFWRKLGRLRAQKVKITRDNLHRDAVPAIPGTFFAKTVELKKLVARI